MAKPGTKSKLLLFSKTLQLPSDSPERLHYSFRVFSLKFIANNVLRAEYSHAECSDQDKPATSRCDFIIRDHNTI